ncbi:MAG TPA: DNA polymerase IV [Nitrososphaerales archaeon]|nr:DNA polymerase IV [Nitrososphaerales archaeon]
MSQIIGHVDLDYFYAQVEEVGRPDLKGRPVIICVFSGRTDESGVVSTANYVARDYGVRSGMPISLAKKKLEGSSPELIRMDHEKYAEVSDRVMEIIRASVDRLEQTGIDEAFFDITKLTDGDYELAQELGARLKGSVLDAEGLTCSVGIARSKAVAKIASDYRKPDGLTVVRASETESFLSPLPVSRLSGVGPKAARALESIRVETLGDLASADINDLVRLMGRKLGSYLWEAAHGEDRDPVREKPMTQLSRIITLKENTSDPEAALNQLKPVVDDLRVRLLTTKQSFRVVSVLGILGDLTMKTKSKTFENPVSDPTHLSGEVTGLLPLLFRSTGREFRRVGVRVSDLQGSLDQTSLAQYTEGA